MSDQITPNQAKKDYAKRLTAAGIKFEKLTAETVSFEGFGFGKVVFVYVYGARFPRSKGWNHVAAEVPKPSEGGYIAKVGNGCQWEEA